MKTLKTNWLIRHSITVFSCVLIIVLGIAALTYAVPVTTTIGENISTNSLTATGLTVDTDTLYVDSTNNRVGVGTITPVTALDVNGTTTSPTILGGTATTQDLSLQTTSGVGTTGADMHFLVGDNGGTEAMTILNNGNVGIGTAAPTVKLEVNSDAKILGDLTPYFIGGIDGQIRMKGSQIIIGYAENSAMLWFNDGNANDWKILGDGGNLTFSEESTEHIRFASGGNVGIGTTDPKTTLDINGSMKITKQSSAPYTCAADYDGAIALTSTYRACVCNGTGWVFISDGTTDCAWQ